MKAQLLFFAFVFALPFWAKSQYYNYAPNTLNIPCLTKKGDATLGIGLGRGNQFRALELQGVYSPVPHLAVMANYFGARKKAVRTFAEQGTDAYLWELAIGAYEQFSKGSASFFAGYGAGSLFSNYKPASRDFNSRLAIRRWFLQPGLAYKSPYFHAGLALRLSRLSYTHGDVAYNIEPPYLAYIQAVEKETPLFLPELGIQAGIRLKPITLSVNLTSIFPDTDSFNFTRLNMNLTLSVDFGLRKKQTE